jgi:8-oxo-dGTP pyrophosphatase MutT (NUDIX family)
MDDISVIPLDRFDLAVAPFDWPFAAARCADIEAHFAARCLTAPGMWNGRILLMRDYAFAGGTLRGSFFEADYAAFLAWQEWGFPDRSVANCFSLGALRAADGAYLLGVMGPHTANAGSIYFPAGTPDPKDVRAGTVDFAGSIVREIAEETGLTGVTVGSRWHAVVDGQYVALITTIERTETAEVLRQAMLRHLASEAQPELSDIRIVRSAADFDPKMPRFVPAYLSHMWAGGA